MDQTTKDLLSAVESILNDGHMNQEHLARLRAAWEACPATPADHIESVSAWAERLSAVLCAGRMPLPDSMKVEGLTGSVRTTLNEMCAVLRAAGHDVPLGE